MYASLLILVMGFSILMGALIINVTCAQFGISTWYTYIEAISATSYGEANRQTGWANLIFLYIIYPFLLGLCAYGSRWLIELIVGKSL